MRRLALLAAASLAAAPAFAYDMPMRKAGLWELKMEFVGSNLPEREMKQCTDATADKLMTANFGGSTQEACSKHDVSNSGGVITVNSVCKFGERHLHLARGDQRQFRQRLYGRGDLEAGRRPADARHGAGRADAHEDRGEMARSLRRAASGPATSS